MAGRWTRRSTSRWMSGRRADGRAGRGPIDEPLEDSIAEPVAEMLAEPIEAPAFEQFEEPAEDELEELDDDLEPTAPSPLRRTWSPTWTTRRGPGAGRARKADRRARRPTSRRARRRLCRELPPPPEDDLPAAGAAAARPPSFGAAAVRSDGLRRRPRSPIRTELPAQRGPGEIAALLAGADLTVVPDHVEADGGAGDRRRSSARSAHARMPAEHRRAQRAHPDPAARPGGIEVDDFGPAAATSTPAGTCARWRGSSVSTRAAARPVRRPLRQGADRGPSGLRGRAGHRHVRRGARRLRRPALEPADRRGAVPGHRVGRGPGLQRRPAELVSPAPGVVDWSAGQTANRKPITSPKMTTTAAGGDRRARALRSSYGTATAGSCGPASSADGQHRRSSDWRRSRSTATTAVRSRCIVQGQGTAASLGTAGEPGSKHFG